MTIPDQFGLPEKAELLKLLKQARTCLKTDQPREALERIRAAIRVLDPVGVDR